MSAERETADRERRDEGAEPVEARRTSRCRFDSATWRHRRPEGDGEQRDVDQEREPPADRVDEDPAEDRPEDRQRRGRGRPDAERAAARRALEGVGDERERPRDEQRAGGALEEPEDDQQLERRREPAQRGGEREPGQADARRPGAGRSGRSGRRRG